MRHLVELKFHFHDKLFRVDFKYDSPGVPGSCFFLGRHKCSQRACGRGHLFSIDGPGGERMTSVSVTLLNSETGLSGYDGMFEYHRDDSVADVEVNSQL